MHLHSWSQISRCRLYFQASKPYTCRAPLSPRPAFCYLEATLYDTFRSPIVTTGSGKRRPDVEGIQGFPLGIVVRGGESERGRWGTSLEEGPENVAFHFAPFSLPFRRSKIVLKKQCQKESPWVPKWMPRGAQNR